MSDRHWSNCWKDRRHHGCALARISHLDAELAQEIEWNGMKEKQLREGEARIRELETLASRKAADWAWLAAKDRRISQLEAALKNIADAHSDCQSPDANCLSMAASLALAPPQPTGDFTDSIDVDPPCDKETPARQAHSKSEYKRLTALGVDCTPPDSKRGIQVSEAHEKTRIRQLEDAAAHWEHKYTNARQYNRNLEARIGKLEAALRSVLTLADIDKPVDADALADKVRAAWQVLGSGQETASKQEGK
jgi:hypothetical protein